MTSSPFARGAAGAVVETAATGVASGVGAGVAVGAGCCAEATGARETTRTTASRRRIPLPPSLRWERRVAQHSALYRRELGWVNARTPSETGSKTVFQGIQ